MRRKKEGTLLAFKLTEHLNKRPIACSLHSKMNQSFCRHLKRILLLPTTAHVLLASNTESCIQFTL